MEMFEMSLQHLQSTCFSFFRVVMRTGREGERMECKQIPGAKFPHLGRNILSSYIQKE